MHSTQYCHQKYFYEKKSQWIIDGGQYHPNWASLNSSICCSIYPSFEWSIHPPFNLSIYSFNPSIHPSVYPHIYPPILPINCYIYLFHLSIHSHQFIHLLYSIHLSIHLYNSIHLFYLPCCIFIHLIIYYSIFISIDPSIHCCTYPLGFNS